MRESQVRNVGSYFARSEHVPFQKESQLNIKKNPKLSGLHLETVFMLSCLQQHLYLFIYLYIEDCFSISITGHVYLE